MTPTFASIFLLLDSSGFAPHGFCYLGLAIDSVARHLGCADRCRVYVDSHYALVFRWPATRPAFSLDLRIVWRVHCRVRPNAHDGNLDAVARELLGLGDAESDYSDFVGPHRNIAGENRACGSGVAAAGRIAGCESRAGNAIGTDSRAGARGGRSEIGIGMVHQFGAIDSDRHES